MENEIVSFNPKILSVGELPVFSMEDIRSEPMLFACEIEKVREIGGKIANTFIDIVRHSEEFREFLNQEGLSLIFDCRTTLTMPNMYPSIPGWHCDDFNRQERFAQPRLNDRDRRIRHFMSIVSEGDALISNTEFISEPLTLGLNPANVWHDLDGQINANPFLKKRSIKNREVIFFSQDSIHRATPTKRAGWRWFGRLSLTYRVPSNEIRKQVQVYTDINNNGW